MTTTRILVAEDNIIEARDIQKTLKQFGYDVSAIVSSGEEAIQKTAEIRPDLVLMDIKLKGEIDGVQAAEQIRTRFDIPVVYLTAYADEDTLQRAKITEPFAYILKPFVERELHTNIEIALYKHKMERTLKEHERWLATTLNSIGDAVIATDKQGQIVFMNPVAESLTGWKQEDALGKDLREIYKIVSEETRIAVEPPVTKVIQENIIASLTNHILLTKDGTEIPVDDSSAPIRDENGVITGVVLVFHDTIARKQTEQVLQESKLKYQTLVEASTDAIFLETIKGRILDCNSSACKMFGYTKEELLGLTVADLVPDEIATTLPGIITEELTAGGIFVEALNKRKDGSIFPVEVSTKLITTGEGQLVVAYIHDITERKHAEEELKKAKAEAESANQAKSEFLANISHELRTPLNAILGYAQIFLRDESLMEKQRDAMRIVHHSGEYLLTIINDILDLTKLEAQKIELEATVLYLPRFLSNLVDMIQVRVRSRGISFTADIASDIPKLIYGDEKRLRQVLLNLLSNAIKFTETGSVTLRVKKIGVMECWSNGKKQEDDTSMFQHSSTPTLQSSNTPIHLRFSVEDTGIGISPEHVEEIFLPFQQVRNKRTHFQGTGLGLTISQKLLRMMGSELHVTSTPDKGSTFWFDVEVPEPVLSEAEGPEFEGTKRVEAKSFQSITGFSGGSRKILIVDDNDENRTVLKDMLSPLGFEVIEAVDGHDALNKTKKHQPDVVLMDLMMSAPDGFETTRHILQEPALKNLIIIGVSASVSSETRKESVTAGCDDFLAKPVDIDALLECLRVHLQLEWIHNDQRISQETPTPSEQQSIISPPKEELSVLYDLVRSGDIANLRKQIPKITALDPKFIPFASKLEQFAREFQMNEIKRFLEAYLD